MSLVDSRETRTGSSGSRIVGLATIAFYRQRSTDYAQKAEASRVTTFFWGATGVAPGYVAGPGLPRRSSELERSESMPCFALQ
jgi:hypothetical protein